MGHDGAARRAGRAQRRRRLAQPPGHRCRSARSARSITGSSRSSDASALRDHARRRLRTSRTRPSTSLIGAAVAIALARHRVRVRAAQAGGARARRRRRPEERASSACCANKYYVDEAYDEAIVQSDRRDVAQPALARHRRRPDRRPARERQRLAWLARRRLDRLAAAVRAASARTRGCWSSACSPCSAPSPFAEAMNAAFLDSIGYDALGSPGAARDPAGRRGARLALARRVGAGVRRTTKSARDWPARPRWIALLTLLVEFVVSIGLWWTFDPPSPTGRRCTTRRGFPAWGMRFTLGIDGIALMMILLTTFIMPLAVLGGWTSIDDEGARVLRADARSSRRGMLGVFMALDLFLFYVMWEVMLVPMYFIIGIWGGERRIYASLKFFIYTMVGSLLMLVAIVYLGLARGRSATGTPNFSYDRILAGGVRRPTAALWLFGAFFLAFAVKVPMFPFHTWLPDAHVEAPTAGSVVLAGDHAEARHVRLPAPRRAALPGGRDAARRSARRSSCSRSIGIIYGALVVARAAGLQEARRVLVGQPPRLRHARHLRAHRAERAGRADGDDQPRPLDRRALLPDRHDLRAAAHAA